MSFGKEHGIDPCGGNHLRNHGSVGFEWDVGGVLDVKTEPCRVKVGAGKWGWGIGDFSRRCVVVLFFGSFCMVRVLAVEVVGGSGLGFDLLEVFKAEGDSSGGAFAVADDHWSMIEKVGKVSPGGAVFEPALPDGAL